MRLNEYDRDLLDHTLGERPIDHEALHDVLRLANSLHQFIRGECSEDRLAKEVGGAFLALSRLEMTLDNPECIQININRRMGQIRSTYFDTVGTLQ